MIERLVLCAVLLAVGLAGGYAWHGDRAAAEVAAAKANESACRAALDSQTDALADVRKALAGVRERHRDLMAAASDALTLRDAENEALTERVAALTKSLQESARVDASCAPLGRLAVCAAVAGQLWPAAEQAAAGDRHAR